jgi:hypothetical protein
MGRTYGFAMTASDVARAELDREEFLASADYLQAFVLEAQLEQQLRGRFGPAWWEQKAAGDWMRGLLAPGNSVSASGLVRALGEERLGVDAFLSKLPAALGWAPPSPPASPGASPAAGPPAPADAGVPPAASELDAGRGSFASDAGPVSPQKP